MRVVVDTNVLVSAALSPQSGPGRVVELVWQRGQLLVSEATLDELHEVLCRPRFDRFVQREHRMEAFAAVLLLSVDVPVIESVTACRDPDDDRILEVAVAGRATHLVTGDGDLLALHPFRGIPILTPAAFLAEVDPSAAP